MQEDTHAESRNTRGLKEPKGPKIFPLVFAFSKCKCVRVCVRIMEWPNCLIDMYVGFNHFTGCALLKIYKIVCIFFFLSLFKRSTHTIKCLISGSDSVVRFKNIY